MFTKDQIWVKVDCLANPGKVEEVNVCGIPKLTSFQAQLCTGCDNMCGSKACATCCVEVVKRLQDDPSLLDRQPVHLG